MKSARAGPAGLHFLEWLALLVILVALVYSAYRVKGEDLKDIRKYFGAETRALEVKQTRPR